MTALNINLDAFSLVNIDKEKAKLADPKQFILDEMGDLSGITVAHNLVLVKIYERAAVTAGGILRTDNNLKEDIWQGAVGLVLKKGPVAFKSDDRNDFGDFNVDLGDWVLFRTADTWRQNIKGADGSLKECRFMQDAHVRAKIDSPDMAY